jgi:hypothetical protein
MDIFAQSSQRENKINIFNNSKSVNLFTIKQQPGGLNIFQDILTAKPMITLKDDDEDSEHSSYEDPKHQEMNANGEV